MSGPPNKMMKLSHAAGADRAAAKEGLFRYDDHREFWVCEYADSVDELEPGFNWMWTQAFNIEWKVDFCMVSKGQELVAATRPLCDSNEEYGIVASLIGCYWMAGFYANMPIFMKEGSQMPKNGEQWVPAKAVMIFYDFNTECWWVCHPGFGQEGAWTEWLGRSVVTTNDFYDFSAMDWVFPHDAAEPSKAIQVLPNHVWWNDWITAHGDELKDVATRKDEHIAFLKKELELAREQLAEAKASNNAEGSGGATSSTPTADAAPDHEEEGAEKTKGGWMNRMVSMLAAIEGEQWQRVNYLAGKFSKHHAMVKPLAAHKKHVEKWGYDAKYDY